MKCHITHCGPDRIFWHFTAEKIRFFLQNW